MMFWDSSGIVPLLLSDAHSKRSDELLRQDAQLTVWWASTIECEGAFARTLRMGGTNEQGIARAQERLYHLSHVWQEIPPDERIRQTARRMIRIHDLRAADSQQLAAALHACDLQTDRLPFVCFDKRLRLAAKAEGFRVLPEAM